MSFGLLYIKKIIIFASDREILSKNILENKKRYAHLLRMKT